MASDFELAASGSQPPDAHIGKDGRRMEDAALAQHAYSGGACVTSSRHIDAAPRSKGDSCDSQR